MNEPVRLSKRVVALTGCSRREAEQYIEGGWVKLDGVVVERPQQMVSSEQIWVDPQADLSTVEPATMVLHKPAGLNVATHIDELITQASHWPEDASGVRPLHRHLQRLAVPLAPPVAASGLLVVTQDWRVRRRLTEDASRIEQEFEVEVSGQLIDKGLALLSHGLSFNHYALPPIKASWQSERRLRLAFKQLDPERIPWMCEAVGLRVVAMKCLRLGRVSLGRMPSGQWRYLAADARI